MRKGMFLRLALTNIKKNRGTYIPYMLSCMGCIAVLYIMMFIVTSPDTVNMRGGRDVAAIVSMGVFFIAVLLVMAGTYLVFTSGSIVILKLLRRRKKFYYKLQNFTSVSGMLYRMKQNAVGLASICILSTGVLLMLSTTVSLNMGIEDTIRSQYPCDVNVDFHGHSPEEAYMAQEFIRTELEEKNIPVESVESQIYLSLIGVMEGNRLNMDPQAGQSQTQNIATLVIIPDSFSEQVTGEKQDVPEGSLLAYGTEENSIILENQEFKISGRLKKRPEISGQLSMDFVKTLYFVADEKTFEKINQLQNEAKGGGYSITSSIGVQVPGDDAAAIKCRQMLNDSIQKFKEQGYFAQEQDYVSSRSYAEEGENFYGLNGGLLFVGILLGGVFLMGTALIIYYKQISEGYEDKARFEIMRKVGMSRREVKASIHRQILMVFFLPLITACVHIGMAFPLMKRLLLLVGMSNTRLFLICTAVTVIIFAAVYGVIYAVTARSYYRILEKAE